jgi:hypothetical protein
MNWKPIIVGVAIGAALGFLMGKGQVQGKNPVGITGTFARPFQFGVDTGKGVRGG